MTCADCGQPCRGNLCKHCARWRDRKAERDRVGAVGDGDAE